MLLSEMYGLNASVCDRNCITPLNFSPLLWSIIHNVYLVLIRREEGWFVVKADGLAAGKAVVVAQSKEEATAAIGEIMCNKKYGSTCGDRIIIEEFLSGFEVSVSTLTRSSPCGVTSQWNIVTLAAVG